MTIISIDPNEGPRLLNVNMLSMPRACVILISNFPLNGMQKKAIFFFYKYHGGIKNGFIIAYLYLHANTLTGTSLL